MREKIAEVMLNTVWKSSEDYHTCMLRVADTILSLPIDEVITLGDLVRMWQSWRPVNQDRDTKRW